MPRYAIIAVIQLLCSQNESIQNDKYDKFPMHLKMMRHSLQGTDMMGPKPLQEKKRILVCVFEVTDNWSWKLTLNEMVILEAVDVVRQ